MTSPLSLWRNMVIGTPQARWRETTQSGRVSTMPVMRFSPCGGTQRVSAIALSARVRKDVSAFASSRLVQGDEPLRRGAEDHRLLRAPGMRVVVLVARPRDQRAGLGQRRDHREIGVAELALVVDHALAFEARRVLGEEAGLVDGEGDLGVDAARFERSACSLPRSRSPRCRDRARYVRSPCRYPRSHARRPSSGTLKS